MLLDDLDLKGSLTISDSLKIGSLTGILKANSGLVSVASASDITSTLLTGLSSASGTISASDTILTAFNKLSYLNNNISSQYLSISGNAASATKLQTARTIALSGGATGTATSFDGTSNISIPVTALSPNSLSYGYTVNQFYLNTHPEGAGVILPFIYNDLAHLTLKGGAMSSYATTDTDYTVLSLTNSGTISINTTNPFDGSPSYSTYTVAATSTVVIIDITCHTTFAYSTTAYIDFGSTNWRAKDVKFYAYNDSVTNAETVYKLFGTAITNNTVGRYYVNSSYSYTNTSSGTSQGFNKLRIVLTNFNNTTPRIACIGLINYGSSGLREVFLSRSGGSLYGTVTPYTNSAYDLGSSSNKWNNIYSNTFIGALTGNASTATKLQTARTLTIGSTGKSFDGSANVSWTLAEIGAQADLGFTPVNKADDSVAWGNGVELFYSASTVQQRSNVTDRAVTMSDGILYLGYYGTQTLWNLQANGSGVVCSGAVTATSFIGPLSGNSSTATKWQTARTLTIGATGKLVDGSSNVAWSLSEIGAQASNSILTSISGLSTSTTGLLKITNGVASLDTSSYLTGNQTITLTGIVTGSGTTAITTAIADGALSIAKTSGLQSALDGKQPLDADLTAIAGLSTQPFGRSLLTQADAPTARTALGVAGAEGINRSIKGVAGPGWVKLSTLTVTTPYGIQSLLVDVFDCGNDYRSNDRGSLRVHARLKQQNSMSSPLDFAQLDVEKNGLTSLVVGYVIDQDDASAKVISIWVSGTENTLIRYSVIARHGTPQMLENQTPTTIPAGLVYGSFVDKTVGSLKLSSLPTGQMVSTTTGGRLQALDAAGSRALIGASDGKALLNWYTPATRPADCDLEPDGLGGLRRFLAAAGIANGPSTTKTSHVLHIGNDVTNGYDTQLASEVTTGALRSRAQTAGVWGAWRTFWDSVDLPASAIGKTLLNAADAATARTTIGALAAADAIVKSPTAAQWIVGQYLGVERATAGAASFTTRVTGDTYARLSVVDNIIKLGSGSASEDVFISRSSSGSVSITASQALATYPGRGIYFEAVGSSNRSPRIDLREGDSLTQWSVESYFGAFRFVTGYNATPVVAATINSAGDYSGKAATATKLATARTLTIGSTGKSFDGSANVSWTLAEIGAQASLGYTPINKAGDSGIAALAFSDNIYFASPTNGTYRGVQGTMGVNDQWRVMGCAGSDNAGFLEIATSDDGTEPIFVRQYNAGTFGTLVRSASLLDGSGNTSFPGTLTTGGYITTPSYVFSSLNSSTIANYVGSWGASGYYGFAGNDDTNTIIRAVTCSNTGVISGYAGISVDKIYTNNNGNGTNVKIGDDVWLGDINIANTMSIKGVANNGIGYIRFGTDSNGFGYNGSRLYYGGAAEIAGMAYASGGFTVPQAVNSHFGASQITRMTDYVGMWGFSATWQFGRGTTVYSSLHTVTATFNEGIDVLGTSYFATANVNNLVAPGLSMTPTSSSLVGDGYTTLNLQAGTTTLPTPTVGRVLFLYASEAPNSTLAITAPSGYAIHYRSSGTSTSVVPGGTSLAFNSSCGIAIGCPVYNSNPVWRLIW